MATQTPTIDVQVHAYEKNHPGRPWHGFLQGPDEVTGDDMVSSARSAAWPSKYPGQEPFPINRFLILIFGNR